ncbi:uncharacterized protein LOC112410801 isoform X1 [Neophocaena asiaeorientalis asiaeorientalis]|uniref:Uncharacterized protein LOC112410801 isoform X1 n=1 Tax=Neophocaena asiaeorientalis asiaeorientalis TaxID=1706337 RepID=A0A341CTY6_NEOAA|nr:uncharacterized protein LOC112410801 isoform X1 [Neophocaena asiaeorientalis asiaeorientalis]
MARGWSPEEPESCQFQGAGPGPSLQISLPRFSASNEQLQGPGVAAQLDSQHTPLILTMAPGPGRGPITAEKIKAGTAANVKEHEAREMPGTAPAEQQRRVHGTFLLLSLLPSLRPLPWTWEPAWVEMLLTVTLSRRTPGPIISALRPNKNQSQSPSRRRPQGKVRAPARQTQQKRSHPSQPGKQRIVSKGKEEPQLSSDKDTEISAGIPTSVRPVPQNLGHLIQPPSNTAESTIFCFNQSLCLCRSECSQDFPGGPVAKTSCTQCRGPGSNPGQGTGSHMPQLRVRMPQLKIPRATMKIPRAATKTRRSQTNK